VERSVESRLPRFDCKRDFREERAPLANLTKGAQSEQKTARRGAERSGQSVRGSQPILPGQGLVDRRLRRRFLGHQSGKGLFKTPLRNSTSQRRGDSKAAFLGMFEPASLWIVD